MLLHPSDASYWDPNQLHGELQRVFDICHSCRRCWNLCPSFGNLFKRLDAIEDEAAAPSQGEKKAPRGEGQRAEGQHAAEADPSLLTSINPVERLSDADGRRVVDECYQCKLCFNHCPYHPPHRFQLDFPRLMQRAKAVRARREGIRWPDRLFARVDWIGRVASWIAPIVNWANHFEPNRLLMEKVLGVARGRNLPRFHSTTFRKWWDWRGPKPSPDRRSTNDRISPLPLEPGRDMRVVLFYTCSVNYNDPSTGKDAVAVLERNGFEVLCPADRCCGMPHLDCGDMPAALSSARRNVEALYPFALQGLAILALGPSCSLMLKEEYPALLRSHEASVVAKASFDIMEFLAKLKREGRLDTRFGEGPGKIAYHVPCHLKAQNIGYKSKELLELLPGASVTLVDRCSAHDGTWGMKKEYYELSMKTGRKLFDEIEQAGADAVATDCPLAGLQIAHGTGKAPRHPIHWVARAYGIESDPA